MPSLNKIRIVAVACLISIFLVPSKIQANELGVGTIIINVISESGETISGNWYLHKGVTEKGLLVRNGSFGEVFQAEEGYYFLEVRGMANKRPYFIRYSKNPQFLYEGSTVTFGVQYFKTQHEMLNATGNLAAPQVLETTSVGLPTNDVFDIYGCNSTKGYAWCEKDQQCTRYWSPACKTYSEEKEAEQESATTIIVSPTLTTTQKPALNAQTVPTFETPPTTSSQTNTLNAAQEAGLNANLAQTGISVSFVLIFSIMLSAGIFRRLGIRPRHPSSQ